jgi:hypothetical protein
MSKERLEILLVASQILTMDREVVEKEKSS